MSKKKQVIEEIFRLCQKRNNFEFDNEVVKSVAQKYGFSNPFDATKVDSIEKLPNILQKKDYALIHLGQGKHRFIKGINNVYHKFEKIDERNIIKWTYKKSLLNLYNTSESNILSIANNQRILHHFLFGEDKEYAGLDINKRPKTYFPHRTKQSFSYNIGDIKIETQSVVIEIDLTIEYNGVIGVFEAKNGTPNDFIIYQLYHPFLYYWNAKETLKGINEIKAIYLVRDKRISPTEINLWAYTFENPSDMSSIRLLRKNRYILIK